MHGIAWRLMFCPAFRRLVWLEKWKILLGFLKSLVILICFLMNIALFMAVIWAMIPSK